MSVFLGLECALAIFMVKKTEVADVVTSRMSAPKIARPIGKGVLNCLLCWYSLTRRSYLALSSFATETEQRLRPIPTDTAAKTELKRWILARN